MSDKPTYEQLEAELNRYREIIRDVLEIDEFNPDSFNEQANEYVFRNEIKAQRAGEVILLAHELEGITDIDKLKADITRREADEIERRVKGNDGPATNKENAVNRGARLHNYFRESRLEGVNKTEARECANEKNARFEARLNGRDEHWESYKVSDRKLSDIND